MKITIIGGGPAGLYFALLMQRRFPEHRIWVLEQNPPDATYGWGVVFSSIRFLQDLYPTFFKSADYIEFIHCEEAVRLDGNPFYRVARIDLLGALQERCVAAGVHLEFGRKVDDCEALLRDNDLVVAADGAYSGIRRHYAAHFGTTLDVRPNKFVWYGTARLFDPVTLVFHRTPHGVFVGHAYRYTEDMSSFVVECSPETWQRAGLDRMSEDESRGFCSRLFARHLEERPLLGNRSLWFNCVIVRNARWWHRNLVLLGDAMRTGHPSIGAGTRLAMGDSLQLFEGFVRHGEHVSAALADFERTRRPKSTELQDAAAKSAAWYETVESRMHLSPVMLAYDFLMRTGRVSHEDLRRRDPIFLERYLAEKEGRITMRQ